VTVKRVGVTIGVRKEALDEYKRIHVKIWPEIAHAIREAGIHNYSIFYLDGQLFGYFEYTGPDQEFEQRMRTLAAAPRMREWWNLTEPMQIARADRKPGDWWTTMEEVFHQD
jgi:L-rhamnose mutarotase